MPVMNSGPVDLVEELRLRRWARLHHVPADERDGDWHPVIHDEMRRKDVEADGTDREVSPYVPLAPETARLHQPHEREAPYFFTTPAPADQLHYT